MESALRSYKNLVNPSLKDERDGCRSLICDANGIIIAEVVYRCMICSSVLNSITEARSHYHSNHIDLDEPNGNQSDDPIMFPEDDLSMDPSSDDEDYTTHYNNNNNSRSHNRNDPLLAINEPRGGKRKPTRRSNANSNNNNSSNTSSSFSPSTAANSGLLALDQCSPGSDVKIQTAGTNGTCTIKSGYITCPVCLCTKFYTTLQRRYGQFSCVGCYRFFKEFFVQPKRFTCPNLGECVLDQRTKCKACWIQRCIDIYTVDDSRKAVLLAHRPLKKSTSSVKSSSSSSVASNNNNNGNQQQVSSSSTRKSSASTIVPSVNGSNVPPVVEGSSLDALNSVAPAHSPLSEVANVNSNLSNGGNNSNGPQANGSNDTGDIGDGCDGSDRIGNSPNVHGGDDADAGCISNDEEPSVLTSDPNSKTASSKSVGTSSSSSISNNQSINNSIKCESDSEESANSIEDADDLPLDGEEGNSSLNMLQASASFTSSTSLDEASNNNHSNLGITTTRAGKTPPRRKTSGRIKNWCCLKCANCLADDCGKCINCLDRPKFGGPFIRKQRCLYKKCLMKTKPVAGNQPY